ncbi:hypothetical protein BC628DRAFT_994272 [Trametes gibbosa]|nr:hypothetical protein BC628DRAFT_994272 [Trametes gibbosa]
MPWMLASRPRAARLALLQWLVISIVSCLTGQIRALTLTRLLIFSPSPSVRSTLLFKISPWHPQTPARRTSQGPQSALIMNLVVICVSLLALDIAYIRRRSRLPLPSAPPGCGTTRSRHLARPAINLLKKRSAVDSDRSDSTLMNLIGRDLYLVLKRYDESWRRVRRMFWRHFQPSGRCKV